MEAAGAEGGWAVSKKQPKGQHLVPALMAALLPPPRRPRTKTPSVEVIVRLPSGGAISLMTPWSLADGAVKRLLRTIRAEGSA